MPADGVIAATGNGSSARPGLGSSIDYQAICYMVTHRHGRGCSPGIGPTLPSWRSLGHGSYRGISYRIAPPSSIPPTTATCAFKRRQTIDHGRAFGWAFHWSRTGCSNGGMCCYWLDRAQVGRRREVRTGEVLAGKTAEALVNSTAWILIYFKPTATATKSQPR